MANYEAQGNNNSLSEGDVPSDKSGLHSFDEFVFKFSAAKNHRLDTTPLLWQTEKPEAAAEETSEASLGEDVQAAVGGAPTRLWPLRMLRDWKSCFCV